MTVNYYFRHQHEKSYSIENVFHSVQHALPPACLVREYFAKSPIDFDFLLKIRNLNADIHHITGAINYAALSLPVNRTLLTIHDLGHLMNTLSGSRRWLYRKLFWDLPLSKVKFLTAISDFTRRQVIKEFSLRGSELRTIHNPVSRMFVPTKMHDHEQPVILQIGNGANKNIECLLKAIEGFPCKLILVRTEEPGLKAQLISMKIEFEFRTNLSATDLVKAYADCDILYFASSYEGFGLPIIEAMASGRPVITSTIDPMKEVAGDAACLVNYKDSNEVRSAITKITESRDYRDELIQRGLDRSRFFSAERISPLYYELYEEMVRNA